MGNVWSASLIVLWLLVLVVIFLLTGVLRELGVLQLRFGTSPGVLITETGLDRGAVAPDFNLIEVAQANDGALQRVRLSEFANGRPTVLVFLSPNCLSCRDLVPHLNEISDTRADDFAFLVICRGRFDACNEFRRSVRLKQRMAPDSSGELEASYDVKYTPFAYLIDSQQRVLIRGIANDWVQFEALLAQEGTLQRGGNPAVVGPQL